jgi:hypothetical protein
VRPLNDLIDTSEPVWPEIEAAGWLRVLGSGSRNHGLASLSEVNAHIAGAVIVGQDLLGGQFAWTGSAGAAPTIHYLAPDTEEWEDTAPARADVRDDVADRPQGAEDVPKPRPSHPAEIERGQSWPNNSSLTTEPSGTRRVAVAVPLLKRLEIRSVARHMYLEEARPYGNHLLRRIG